MGTGEPKVGGGGEPCDGLASHPRGGEKKYSYSLLVIETAISSGLMGHLARMQTLCTYVFHNEVCIWVKSLEFMEYSGSIEISCSISLFQSVSCFARGERNQCWSRTVEGTISFKRNPGFSFDSCLKQFKDSLVAVTSKPILRVLSINSMNRLCKITKMNFNSRTSGAVTHSDQDKRTFQSVCV